MGDMIDLDRNGEALHLRTPQWKPEIQTIFALAQAKGATDIHLIAGSPILFRIEGELVPMTRRQLDADSAMRLGYSLLSKAEIERLSTTAISIS